MSKTLQKAIKPLMIDEVPSYGNKFFYSLGFLSAISFTVLIISGLIMTLNGPTWWLTGGAGTYTRSVHMWATQAFVLFIILHLLIVFLTSGFKKPRRLTWVIGVLMLFTVLAETEFGYVLRGDFSSQWRGLQGADFYNGSGLGRVINPLNYKQIYGIHIAVIPFALIGLLFLHYLLVRVLGIAKPYRKDVKIKQVKADHKKLFARGGILIVMIMGLALVLPSPFLKPTTIQSVATQDPYLMGKTLVTEFDNSSGTAGYMDNINPYTYNIRVVYINDPYEQLIQTQPNLVNQIKIFNNQPADTQKAQLKDASDYYGQDQEGGNKPASPVMSIVASLITMAQAGLYQPALAGVNSGGGNADESTYVVRFLADSGVLEDKAKSLNITTEQYGMIREESGKAPGAWWLAPIGLLNHTVLANDDNGDRDAAIIFGSFMLTMLAFPYIPYVNQIPDKLKLYRLIWREKK
jgi:ubiquinol-cytochrome c reductase cytochrome b subunit